MNDSSGPADPPDRPTARQRDWARRAAFHYLERYASTEANLARVLRRKLRRRALADPEAWSLPPEDAERLVAEAVAACRGLGFVNDAAYAELKVAGGRRRGHSSGRIRSTMAAKGVSREVADAALAADGIDDERRAALVHARRRRLGPFRASGVDADGLRRDMAALCRQGFAPRLAREIVGMDIEAAEAALAEEGAADEA